MKRVQAIAGGVSLLAGAAVIFRGPVTGVASVLSFWLIAAPLIVLGGAALLDSFGWHEDEPDDVERGIARAESYANHPSNRSAR